MREATTGKEGTNSQSTEGSPSRLLEIDAETFRARFNRMAFPIRHHLANHPLFGLGRLIELARRLPDESVKYNAGDIPVTTPLYGGPRTGLSTEETIRRIQECNSWMVLKNVETDPEYGELLDRCLDEVQGFSRSICPGMHQREGFIFISSPSAVAPYHMDPEHNFLLQISGTKLFNVWDGRDRSVLSEVQIEEFFNGAQPQPTFQEENRQKASVFELRPGDGLHVPVAYPHWVQNADEVSISFSITFRSRTSVHQEIVLRVNRRLRKFGMNPIPHAASSLRDSAKVRAFLALRGIKRLAVHWIPGRLRRKRA